MNESNKANDHGTPEPPVPEPVETGPLEPEIIEPELGSAEISEDVAETVDLEAAEAEAAAVEREAKLATLSTTPGLVKSDAVAAAAAAASTPGTPADPVPAPAAADAGAENDAPHKESPAGDAGQDTEPGGEPAVDPPTASSPGASPKAPGHIGPGIDDGHGWRRPEAKWEQSSTPWKPKGESWLSPSQISRNAADAAEAAAAGGPGEEAVAAAGTETAHALAPAEKPAAAAAAASPPSSGPAPTTGGAPDAQSNPKKILIVAGIVLVGLALLVFFIVLLVGLFTGGNSGTSPAGGDSSQAQQSLASHVTDTAPGTEGDLIVADVSPLDWMEGDCLRDFKDTSTPADVVLCNSPHGAQLVGTFYYGAKAAFPGAAALKAKAAKVCEGVQFTSEASGLTTLKQTTAYPSESTWKDKDDRRVDCLVHDTRGGNPLTASLTL